MHDKLLHDRINNDIVYDFTMCDDNLSDDIQLVGLIN